MIEGNIIIETEEEYIQITNFLVRKGYIPSMDIDSRWLQVLQSIDGKNSKFIFIKLQREEGIKYFQTYTQEISLPLSPEQLLSKNRYIIDELFEKLDEKIKKAENGKSRNNSSKLI